MTLRTRLLLAFSYVLLLVLVALAVPLAINLSKRVNAEIEAESAGQAQLIAASTTGLLGERATLTRLVVRSAEESNGRVIIVDARGRLLADSSGVRPGTSYASRPEIRAALGGQTEQGIRHSDSLGEDLLFTSVPILRGGRAVGVVRITQSVDEVQEQVRNDVLALVALGVVALGLGILVAWLLAGSLSRPMRTLSQAARRVTGGDLDARAPVTGSAEQKEVAQAFNDMTEQLSRTLAAQQEFVANASHQLRTPLTGLQLRIESASDLSGDPQVVAELAEAERETQRLAALLTDLLKLAREAERPAKGEAVSLRRAAAAACERWDGPARRRGDRLACRDGAEVLVHSSEGDIAIMLDNLIENAIKYSPRGSRIEIEPGEAAGLGFIAVLDEGPGLSAEEQTRVFDRFYRSSAEPGTGLGLSIVSTLAKRWGGTTRIQDRPEGGARAEIQLPLAEAYPNDSEDFAKSLPARR